MKMKVEKQFINSIKKIYSYAQICIDPLYENINVNRGVLQGSELALLLFNDFSLKLLGNYFKKKGLVKNV